MTKRLICFSLWGNNPKYTVGAIRNAELASLIYPEWKCRFYVGNDVENTIIDKLIDLNSEIVHMDNSGWNGMMWRFLAADSDDIIISRDTDSRLNHREKYAVDDWLNSNKDFHIMRDHPFHAFIIMGGMWGVRNGVLKGITNWIQTYNTKEYDNKYQVDQNFLKDMVYPIVKDTIKTHDEFFEKQPFPVPRTGQEFVGEVYDEYDTRHPEHYRYIPL